MAVLSISTVKPKETIRVYGVPQGLVLGPLPFLPLQQQQYGNSKLTQHGMAGDRRM